MSSLLLKWIERRNRKREVRQQLKLEERKAQREKNRAKLNSWTHREELIDINFPPLNILPRIRDLKYPLSSPVMVGNKLQHSSDQMQSKFFRLPTEIRLKIYKEYMGNHTVHLHCGYFPGDWRGGRPVDRDAYLESPSRDRLKRELEQERLKIQNLPEQWHFFHSVCSGGHNYAPVCDDWHCVRSWEKKKHLQCLYSIRNDEGYISREPFDVTTLGVMPLLLTCRRTYTESIQYLYSCNVFSFRMTTCLDQSRLLSPNNPSQKVDLTMLKAMILPQHFHFITSLDLEMCPLSLNPELSVRSELLPNLSLFDEANYNDWWEMLASMSRLQKLHVDLVIILSPPLTDAITDAVLQPIYRMRDKSLLEFHISAPDHLFRLFRRATNPPYTSVSFYHQLAVVLGNGADVWYEQDSIEGRDRNSSWYPIYV